MNINNKKNFLFEEVSSITGIGQKLSLYLKKKKLKKLMTCCGTSPTHTQTDLKLSH